MPDGADVGQVYAITPERKAMKQVAAIALALLLHGFACAQGDTLCHQLRVASFIAPATGLAAGSALTFVPSQKHINEDVRDNVQQWRNNSFLNGAAIRVDDVVQYAPLASMYLLKACGVQGKHDYIEITRRAAMCYSLVFFSTLATKTWFEIPRPCKPYAPNSFFSGHTTVAFAGAEMLRLEYRNVSPWIGVGAYGASTLTGLLRIYNNRHWLGDVLAGAGVGILCAQLSYWFCDMLQADRERKEPISPYHGYRL